MDPDIPCVERPSPKREKYVCLLITLILIFICLAVSTYLGLRTLTYSGLKNIKPGDWLNGTVDSYLPKMDLERQRKDRPNPKGENCMRTVTYIIVLLIIFAVLGYDVYLASRTDNSDIVKPLVTILRNQTLKSVLDGIAME